MSPADRDPVHGAEAARWGGWHWSEPALERRGEHFRRCSYCGSIHPDDLVAEPSWRAEWADQKYGWPHKFYVDIVNRDPDRMFAISAQFGPDDGGERPGMLRTDSLPPDLEAEMVRQGYEPGSPYRGTHVGFGKRAVLHAKFYSVHLADPRLSEWTLEKFAEISGLSFTFTDDGRVSWRRA